MKKNNCNKLRKRNDSKKGIFNVAIILLFILFIFIISSNVNAKKYYDTRNIVVSENDTLWSIAEKISKKNDDLSIYTVINDIKNINGIDDSMIYAGQTLKIYKY